MDATQKDSPAPKKNANRYINSIMLHWMDIAILLLFAGIIVSLDQWTKIWVRSTIPIWTDLPIFSMDWLTPYARFRHVYNTGAAFGMFQQGGWFFATLAVIVSLLIISYYPTISRRDWWLRLALGLQLGGALGNLIDRIMFGGVTDFISIGTFAIFNVADSCISVGVALLIIGVWWIERKNKSGPGRSAG